MKKTPPVLGIVGWKNSGKTTLVTKLVSHLSSMGFSVSTIKHTHHSVDLETKGTDTYRHRQAGASETVLLSEHRFALLHELASKPHGGLADKTNTINSPTDNVSLNDTLQTVIQRLDTCDLVLLEGFKHSPFAKLEVVREHNSQGLVADNVDNIVALVSDLEPWDTPLPLLDLNNLTLLADWVINYLNIPYPNRALDKENNTLKEPNHTSAPINNCYDDSLTSAQTVWEAIAASIKPTPSQWLALDACANLHLANTVHSHYDSPRFNNVAVDGWAVNYAQLHTHNYQLPSMPLIAHAGTKQHTLIDNHCIRVFTGAPMPLGADTVVMQEDVTAQDNKVLFPSSIQSGINWRPQGEDVKKGQPILTKHHRLRPQDIGLAAATGHSQLSVHLPVKVALLSTGDELNDINQTSHQASLDNARIYDTNRPLLKALYQDFGCHVTDLGIVKDQYQAVVDILQAASLEHHLIVTSGGASTGDHDHIANALQALGQLDTWRVAIKPGRPLAFGRINQALFLGLPGNPVAANVCSLMFGWPLVRALAGGKWQRPQGYPQTLGFDIKKRLGRREWIRVTRHTDPITSKVTLQRSASHGSGILTSMTRADGLVEVIEDIEFIPTGSQVNFIPFSQFS